jgi:small-conductance mechanosensitive channel
MGTPIMPTADLQELLEGFEPRRILFELLLTLVLFSIVFGVRWLGLRALRTRGLAPSELRRFAVSSRTVAIVVFILVGATLWLDELKTFALSAVAFAAAIVIATKELIMCAGGSFLRASSRMFDVGDRIEIAGMRGDVVDTTFFTTTIIEIGPDHDAHQQTGRGVTFPNGLLLTQPCINETWTERFLLHAFAVPVEIKEWSAAEKALYDALVAEVEVYAQEARRAFEDEAAERILDLPSLEPRVVVRQKSPTEIELIARLPVPRGKKGHVEQAVMRRYLSARTGQQSQIPPLM